MSKKNMLVNIIGVTAFILLLISFMLKNMYGQQYCDIARLFGFLFLLIFSIIQIRNKKK